MYHAVSNSASASGTSQIPPERLDQIQFARPATLPPASAHPSQRSPDPNISIMRDGMLEALDLKLNPITSSIKSLGQSVLEINSQLHSVHVTASAALQKSEDALAQLGSLESRLQFCEALEGINKRLIALEQNLPSMSSGSTVPLGITIDQSAREQISRLEQQINFLSIGLAEGTHSHSPAPLIPQGLDSRIAAEQSVAMAVGGFPLGSSLAKCSSLLSGELMRLKCTAPSKIYCKGSSFKQILWFKFASYFHRANHFRC